jgi:AraC family transcriptional regulator of adaptative response / DNA-3-methyladenine glycosylase II
VRVLLTYRAPYAWTAIVRFLEARAIPGVEVVDGDRYLRSVALECGGERVHGVLVVEPTKQDALQLTVHGLAPVLLPTVVARVRRIFDLDAAPDEIEGVLKRDPLLQAHLTKQPGLRVPGAWEGFELAVRGIVGQQITVVQATRLVGKLVAQHGEPLAVRAHDALTHVFPAPAQVATADLSMLGMPGARRTALHTIAAGAAEDPALFEPGESLLTSVAKLRALPGIGEWTAQYIAMRALREPDAFLAADVGLHRALTRADGSRPTPKELLRIAEAWRPYRAYAALHLWTSLSGQPAPPRTQKLR